jgi:hypothetical protein
MDIPFLLGLALLLQLFTMAYIAVFFIAWKIFEFYVSLREKK